MAITTAMPTSFKAELMQILHNFTASTGHAFKIALIKASETGTYGAGTTNYSDVTGNSDEVTGTGYTAGGEALTNVTPTTSGTTAFTDFDDVTWANADFSANGCLIYNTTSGDRAAYVGSFGGTKTASGGDFAITMPAADAANAILRLA